jgi:Zn-dependent protease with chaperone function
VHPYWKSWFFVLSITGLILWAGWSWHRRDGLLWSVPVVLSINYFLLIHSRWKIVPDTEERNLAGHDGWSLTQSLNALCSKAHVKPPKVIIIEVTTPQAFLKGRSSSSSTLYITQGFLDRLSAEEREAILAVEVAALKLHYPFNFFVLGAFFDVIFWWIAGLDRFVSWTLGTKMRLAHSITFWTLSPALFLVQRWCISHQDFYRIDELAAELCANKEALCQALWKLDSTSRTLPLRTHPAWTHVFAVGPWMTHGPLGLLQPQPSVKRRIHKLSGAFPI